jgi:hypothetical protein
MSGIVQGLIASLKSAAAAATDAYFNLVTLLLNTSSTNGAQNNTFLDSSSNNFTITRNGNTTQGTFTPFSQTGWSNYISTVNDYVKIASNAAYGVGTGNFTLEAFFYVGALGTRKPFTLGSSSSEPIAVTFTASNIRIDIAGTTNIINVAQTIPLNSWNHIAFVRSGTGSGQVALYLNGSRITTGTSSGSIAASDFQYGGIDWAGTYGLVGYYSNVRYSNTARYSGTTYTVPTTPFTSDANTLVLAAQSNRFVNTSSYGGTVTTSAASIQAFSPFTPTAAYDTTTVGGSGYFDGTGDSLTRAFTSTTDGMYLQGSTYTVEAWVYPLALSGTQYIYICNASNVASYGYNALYLSGTSAAFATRVATSGTEYSRSGGTVTNNQWFHIAVSVSSNVAKLFLNGTQIGANLTIAANTFTPTGAGIGQNQNGAAGGTNFNGYISNLRITQGAALYTGSFTPSTTPLTTSPPSGTASLLLSATNAGIYDAAAKNVLETVGNAQVSTTQAKFGTTSMSFDGTGDYLVTKTTNIVEFGTGDFTIEGWVYFNSVASVQTIATNYTSSTLGWGFQWRSDTGIWNFFNGDTQLLTYTNTPSTNTWIHFAVARSGTSLKMFINGTQVASTTNSTSLSGATRDLLIGALFNGTSYVQNLNAYLDDIRITKGYARYTANFTAPTAAFPVQ